MATALLQLLQDVSSPNSCIVAHVHQRNGKGVPKQHFDQLHNRFCATSWSSSQDWKQSVEYRARGHSADACTEDVMINYDDKDPLHVQCKRTESIGTAAKFTTVSQDGVEFQVEVLRTRDTAARPPEQKSRYKEVVIRSTRLFTRQSSSFKSVSFTFTLTVAWSARCLGDAYNAKPTYHVSVALSLLNEDTDNLLSISDSASALAEQQSSASFCADITKLRWLETNVEAKIKDVCQSTSKLHGLTPEAEQAAVHEAGRRKGKKRCHGESTGPLLHDYGEQELCPEVADEEMQECFDQDDDEFDEYM